MNAKLKNDYEKIFKNGNFGIAYLIEKEKEVPFVVCNNTLVYEDGEYDFIDSFKNIKFSNDFTEILYVTVADSFKHIKKLYDNRDNEWIPPLYKKGMNKSTEEKKATRAILTLSQIKEKLGVDELTIICE